MSALQREIRAAVGDALNGATEPLKRELAEIRKLLDMAVMERDQPLFGLREAARLLGLHEATLRRKVRDGELPCRRIGKKIFFDRRELFTK